MKAIGIRALVMMGCIQLAAVASTSSNTDPLAVIAAYKGTWQAEIEQFDSAFSKAGKTTKVIVNDCWRAALFYTCAQTVDGKHGALLVFTWDGNTKTYATYPVPPDGGPVSKGKLHIEGDNWYFPWDQEENGVTVHFRVVNHFVGRDTIEYRQEFSGDGTKWNVIGRGIEHRQMVRIPARS